MCWTLYLAIQVGLLIVKPASLVAISLTFTWSPGCMSCQWVQAFMPCCTSVRFSSLCCHQQQISCHRICCCLQSSNTFSCCAGLEEGSIKHVPSTSDLINRLQDAGIRVPSRRTMSNHTASFLGSLENLQALGEQDGNTPRSEMSDSEVAPSHDST